MLPKVLTHVVSGTGNGDVAVRPYLDDSSKQKRYRFCHNQLASPRCEGRCLLGGILTNRPSQGLWARALQEPSNILLIVYCQSCLKHSYHHRVLFFGIEWSDDFVSPTFDELATVSHLSALGEVLTTWLHYQKASQGKGRSLVQPSC